MDKRMTTLLRGVVLLACALADTALAQDVARRETVMNRARPELDALGMRAGRFLAFPRLGVEVQSNDNIFADPANEVDDTIMVIRPELLVESDWGRHALVLGADAAIGRYDDADNEDYDDFGVWADGRLDLGRGQLQGGLRHRDLHEERTSPDDRGGTEPTEYSTDAVTAAWLWRPSRLLLRLSGGYETLDYDDTPGAVPPDNDDRDRDVLNLGVRSGYEISPDYALWAEVRGTTVDYDQTVDNDGFERSSDGYDLVVGSTMDFSGVTFGEVFAGYRSREYDDARYSDSDGATFGVDVTWNVTGLTTLTVLARQSVEATTIVGASGIDTTSFGLKADHELLRNLIVSASVSDVTEDYDGIDRQDDITRAGVQLRYLMNRRFHWTLGYDLDQRDTSGVRADPDDEYDMNLLFLRLEAQI